MTTIELSRSLMGKVSIEERYFRVLVSYLISGGKMRWIYREHTWAKYIKDMGEDEGVISGHVDHPCPVHIDQSFSFA